MSDAEVLLAEGYKVKLADGSERDLQFRNRSAMHLEKRYGGISRYMQALRENTLEVTAYTFATVFGTTPEKMVDLIDARQVQKYIVAITGSLTQFFGLEIARCMVCEQGLPGDAKFCPNCGTAVPQEGEVPSQETETSSLSPGQDSSTPPWSSSESTRAASGTG
jgi:hypothetical protein